MSASKRWWLIIAAFLVVNLLAAVGLLAFAHTSGESRVLPGYLEQK